MPAPVTKPLTSAAAYLELERHAEVKHEFHFGKLLPMPGESKNANRIVTNLTLHFARPLRRKNFETFDHNVKVEVTPDGIYRYPDFVVAHKADDADAYLIHFPILLAEVASEESWRTYTVVKRREYLKLPSLKYYLIISQDEMHVELCSRNEEGAWEYEMLNAPDERVRLSLFELDITLAALYEEVVFGQE